MSHFTKINTVMVEASFIRRALDDLGWHYDEGELPIRGWRGDQTPAQIRVRVPNSTHDIGLRRTGETYEIVADWYGIRMISRQKFVDDLSQRYAYHAILEKLGDQGFTLASEQLGKDKTLHLVLRRVS